MKQCKPFILILAASAGWGFGEAGGMPSAHQCSLPCLLSLVMPRFTEQVEAAVEALSSDPAQPMDENEFIDASRLVYDGIRDIRKAVLMIRVSNCIPDVLTASYHLLNLSNASFWNSADAVAVY